MSILRKIWDSILDVAAFIGILASLIYLLTHQKQFKREAGKLADEMTQSIRHLTNE